MIIRRVLIAVDESGPGLRALETGSQLTAQLAAEVALVHVIKTYDPQGSLAPADELAVREAGQELLMRASSLMGGVRYSEAFLREGDPAAEILAAAEQWDADLIVIGTHGRTGIGHALLGSTAEAVVRQASCPVLTVRT
jgi:nucleotide-binding universal stress UspA family protein